MPWLGYLDRIQQSDIFVFLDNVQFEKNSFTNRNRIKTQSGIKWLTVPVKLRGHLTSTMLETAISADQPWSRKHLSAIEASYGKAPLFKQNFPKIRHLLNGSETTLADLCWAQLQFWMSEFAITTLVVRASALNLKCKKSELILELCESLGAARYLSGPFGKDYLDESAFAQAGIEIEYQKFEHPVYQQLWGDFIPGLSCLDFWMNAGAGSVFNAHDVA